MMHWLCHRLHLLHHKILPEEELCHPHGEDGVRLSGAYGHGVSRIACLHRHDGSLTIATSEMKALGLKFLASFKGEARGATSGLRKHRNAQRLYGT
ncbi:hypothetical protein GUJ93_ZPchr0013g35020 [Zizania palustris]|uniref:Uncharacterized protein n=1 Tax=Zizania palustris TaxID=103762 RepID=A0A8J5X5Q2_ZIZPA|nr:hypothetical protein GUJ93_ZPchr0013g35020 [Zizania palustris]